jgi:uncharacterized repeat protein (TIGR03847 family)
MSRQVFRHERPDRCVVGTVGEPGQRTFFLQARSGTRLTSVVLEKTQVAALVDRLEGLLDDLAGRSAAAGEASGVDDLAPLEVPLEEEFRVGSMSLSVQPATGEVELVATAMTAGDDEAEEAPEDTADVLVVRLGGVEAVRSFVRRARAVVAAGRPPCPLCGQPLDPAGHVCPRQNGFHRRS